MSEKKLSPKMQAALAVVTGEWESAYGLRLSMATLEALRSRGLVEKRGGLGCMFSPRTSIKWRLTPSTHDR